MSNHKDKLQEIVDNSSAMKIDGVLVDLYSASALLNIYNAISEEKLPKLISLPIDEQVGIAFKLLNDNR